MKYKIIIFILDTIRKISAITKLRIGLMLTSIVMSIALVSPYIFNSLAIIMFNKNNYSNAKTIWQTASIISLQNKDVMLANLGNTLYRQSQPELAVEKYEKAINYASGDMICKIKWNLAVVLTSLGDGKEFGAPTEAISYYSRALLQLSDEECLKNPEYQQKWSTLSKKLEEKIAKINESLKEIRQNTYEPDEETKELNQTDKQNMRQDLINGYRKDIQYSEETNLSEEDRINSYSESWW